MNNDLKALLTKIGHTTEFLGVDLVDPNQRGIFGNTPLKVVLTWGDEEAVKMLLDAGADVNATLEDQDTPLHAAARFAGANVVKLLLDRGANPNAVNDDGMTPAQLAKLLERPDIERLLPA